MVTNLCFSGQKWNYSKCNLILLFFILTIGCTESLFAEKSLPNKNSVVQNSMDIPGQNINSTLSVIDKELPLYVIPAKTKNELPFVFFISGDGGWISFDQEVSDVLANRGLSVVGLDAQKYFWKEKNPKDASRELGNVISQFMQVWNKKSFVLIGYSFGASVTPFIASNLTETLKKQMAGIYCFSPEETGDFEIHISDMLSFRSVGKYNVLNELKNIKHMNPVCIFGEDEDKSIRTNFLNSGLKIEILEGKHHYSDDYKSVAGVVLKHLNIH